MTLLDDLQALDLSAILDGKLDISVVIDSDAISALVGGGAVTSVLGDVGTAIEVALASVDDPAAMVAPIVELLADVLDQIDLGDVPIAEYIDAVTSAAHLISGIVSMFTGDPAAIDVGGAGGLTAGGALDLVGQTFGDHASVVSGELARFRSLVESVEQGLPSDPATLLGPALEILIPFPTGSIEAMRSWAEGLQTQFDAVSIDPQLTTGLIAAFGDVQIAAEAGDAVAVQQALASLEQVRLATIGQLANALRMVASAVSGIRIGETASMVTELRGVLGNADETVFELMDGWRAMIATVRGTVESIDPAVAMSYVDGVLDEVEATARDVLLAGVDGAVEVVKQWLRDLLREIPIRPLRLKVSQAIASAATAIADADLDAPVEVVRGALTDLSSILDDADPAALVQNAVAEIEAVVTDLIDTIGVALASITDAINTVATQAQSVLERAVVGLRDFGEVVDTITTAIENAGIMEAANEIAATLESLREDVSALLSSAPIPDVLREGVDQIISTVEAIDLDAAIGGPLREVAAQIQIPPEVATTVRDGLEAVAETVTSLIPADVTAELEAVMADAIAAIEGLDVSAITGGVTELFDDAASVFDSIRVAELIAPAGEVYAELLGAIDRVHPRVILRPAIDLYGEILGSISVPDPATMATRAADLTSQAGEAAARAATEPARQAVGPSATTPPAGAPSGPGREEPPDDLRPGDVVRLIGFLPAKLREALSALDTGAANEVIASVDQLFTGSAEMLRTVRDRVVTLSAAASASLDIALAPLAAAQIDAQLALQGSAVLTTDGFDVDVSFAVLASAGPGPLERSLDGERELVAERCADAAASLSGAVAADLDQVAELLDAVLPSALLSDIDAFLEALDPEPIAAEFDALLAAVLDATPAFLAAAEDEFLALETRIRGLIETFSPGTLMQRFLGVLDVIREELALLDPGRLADELGEIHAQIRLAVAAYDPLVIAGDLDALIIGVAASIRGLDPAGLMPDLDGLGVQVARLGEILPINALEGVGTELEAVGTELRELDIQGMLDAVNALTPEIAEAITVLIEAIRSEIVHLLESIRYSSSSGSASASVSVGVG